MYMQHLVILSMDKLDIVLHSKISYRTLLLPSSFDLLVADRGFDHMVGWLQILSNNPPPPPPHQGACSMLKTHSTLRVDYCSHTLPCCTMPNTLAADLKVYPLSDTILAGIPRQAVNLLKHLRNTSVVRLGTSSRWIPLGTQHVNKHSHTF